MVNIRCTWMILFLLAAASTAAATEQGRGDDGCVASGVVYPWRFNHDYVPDPDSEPELFAIWENDLYSVGFLPSLSSGGVRLNSGDGVDKDRQESDVTSSTTHNVTAVATRMSSGGIGPAEGTNTTVSAGNMTALPSIAAESVVAARVNVSGEVEAADSEEEVTVSEPLPVPASEEKAASSSEPEESSSAKVEETSSDPAPAAVIDEKESSSSEGAVVQVEEEDVKRYTEQLDECMDPDDVEDNGRVFLGSDWTGTGTQKKKVKKFRKFLKKEYKDIDVVWLGDSILENWLEMDDDSWKDIHKPFRGRVANLGMSGVEADFGLYALWEWLSESRLYPKLWVIQLGVNDCFHRERDTPLEIYRNIRDIVRLIRRINCQSGIIISAILPAGDYKEDWSWKRSPHRSCIEETNERVRQWVEWKNFNPHDVSFVDCSKHYLDEDAEEIPRKLSYDGVHPTKKGYRSMEECYKRALEPFAERRIASVNSGTAPDWSQELANMADVQPVWQSDGLEWMYSGWSNCSAGCGLGFQSRVADCIRSTDGAFVSGCDPAERAPLTRPCFAATCETSSWVAGPWSECSAACGADGTAVREVACVSTRGIVLDAVHCKVAAKPREQKECNRGSCGVCGPDADCSGNGDCAPDGCTCANGWRGAFCSVRPDCAGVASGSGCCQSGLVSTSGACCPFGHGLDVSQGCCPLHMIDACGVCGGSGTAVDINGGCCEGPLDAAGRCCAAPSSVDACGVCGGANTTCGVALIATVAARDLSTLQVYLDSVLPASIASAAGVDATAVQATAVTAQRAASRNSVEARVELVVKPHKSPSTVSPIVEAVQSMRVPGVAGVEGQGVRSIDSAHHSGVCGNGVCEKGEMWVLADVSLGHAPDGTCLSDCVAPQAETPRGCPTSTELGSSMLSACSGRGTCISVTGACDCQPGHSGPDCSQCEAGYERVDMLPFFACTPSPGGAISGLSSDPSSSGNINPLAAGLVAGLLMALAAAVAIVLFFVWRTTRTETAPISDGSSDVDVKGKAPMQRPDTPPPSMGASSSHDEIEPTIVHSHDA